MKLFISEHLKIETLFLKQSLISIYVLCYKEIPNYSWKN